MVNNLIFNFLFRNLMVGKYLDIPWCCLCFHSYSEVPFERVSDGCSKASRKSSALTNIDWSSSIDHSLRPPLPFCCKDIHCGCGIVERDHHVVSGGMFLVVLHRTGVLWFRSGSADVHHRYYAKTSNNKWSTDNGYYLPLLTINRFCFSVYSTASRVKSMKWRLCLLSTIIINCSLLTVRNG